MENKTKDTLYCGVNPMAIENATPKINHDALIGLYIYITERYKVHALKDFEECPAPWTANEIIANHRFTNVRRELDKQTKWLIENISTNDELTFKDKVLNTILFRLFSKYETLELIGAPFHWVKDMSKTIDMCRAAFAKKETTNPSYKFFTTAFFTNGVKGALSNLEGTHMFPLAVVKYINRLSKNCVVTSLLSCETQEDAYKVLRNLPAMGDFIAYQVYVDLTYIPEFPFSENEFTVAGVGCIKGLKYLFDDFDEMTYEEALFWLRDNINDLMVVEGISKNFSKELRQLMVDLPIEERYMNVMSLENCMCELGKYMDIVNQVGRPRPKYLGGK
jgi:hypothetical protein